MLRSTSWFVLNFIPQVPGAKPDTYIKIFNSEHPQDALQLFAPKLQSFTITSGEVRIKERPLTYHYIFVRGNIKDIKTLCAGADNGLSILLDRGSSRRHAIVDDKTMESFMTLAAIHNNSLPFYDLEDIDLEEGDLVKVVDGPYAGLTGTYLPRPRSNKGNLILAATSSTGSIVWDIEAKYVQILRFARNSHRQYDILDAFIPKLYPILRKHYAGTPLAEKEKSVLKIFNRRMGTVVPDNHKLEAKLAATLICVKQILGDTDGMARTRARFQRRLPSVTNPWTHALITLLLTISSIKLPDSQSVMGG